MKRIKFFIISIAILFAVTAALATHQQPACTMVPNYYLSNGNYIQVGVYGQDYTCSGTSGVCTYYLNANVYTPCQAGLYTPMSAKEKRRKK